jgi:predicted  nucleic acid-binding Zn-ribbon protein
MQQRSALVSQLEERSEHLQSELEFATTARDAARSEVSGLRSTLAAMKQQEEDLKKQLEQEVANARQEQVGHIMGGTDGDMLWWLK